MKIESTIEKVQGGYEVIAPCGYHLGSQGEHSYLCHSMAEAEIAAAKFYPCSCDRECVEARAVQS
jgi:hypothetical protein